MEEEAITNAKSHRAKLKTKITTLTQQLVKPRLKLDRRTQLYDELVSTHDEFLLTHNNYCDLVSDDKHEEHRTVNGLTLEQYLTEVNETYDKGETCYIVYAVNGLCADATLAVKKAQCILSQCDSTNPSDFDTLCIQAKTHRDLCKALYDDITAYDSSNAMLDTLSEWLCKLDCVEIRRSKNDKAPNTVHFSSTIVDNGNVSSQPHVSSPMLTPQSGLSSHGSDSHVAQAAPPLQSSSVVLDPSDRGHGQSTGRLVSHSASRVLNSSSIVSMYRGRSDRSTLPLQNSSSDMSGQTRRFKFEKTPLPKFNGDRKTWVEFRSVWLEYAHNEFCSDKERAWALKNCLSGEARDIVAAIQSHHDGAYTMMLQRLDEKYSDISSNIQSVCSEFEKLSPVSDDDVSGLLKFINSIERSYSQLGEVDQIDCISIVQVNKLVSLLPAIQKREWRKLYRGSDIQDQKYPFHLFMSFLESERDIIITDSHSDSQASKKSSSKKVSSHSSSVNDSVDTNHGKVTPKSKCLYHDEFESVHSTNECKAFIALPVNEKYDLLKSKHACFKCLGKHPRNKCKEFKTKCSKCGKPTHHSLLCQKSSNQAKSHSVDAEPAQASAPESTDTSSYMCDSAPGPRNALLPIQDVKARSNGRVVTATVFFDGGSNASFITKAAARRLNARRLNIPINLGVTTTGNKQQRVVTHPYEVSLLDSSGSVVKLFAYRMDEITGKVPPLDMAVISKLFPDTDVSQLARGSNVDIMIGGELLGLHPAETVAMAGEHLKISKGPFGLCIHGSHPELSSTGVQVHLCRVSGGEGSSSSYYFKCDRVDSFIQGEDLGTDLAIKCGSCKCGKCPSPGYSYSFREEKELEMIRSNLKYDEDKKCWLTAYPWLKDPSQLPENYQSALATLRSTEKVLRKDASWANIYNDQIVDMVNRNVARKLSPDELSAWNGPVFYISHLAVRNPKSQSTPVRIVFNSSQVVKGVSLNSFLAKGPDAYLNSIPGILLRWRENPVALIGDIKKMYNSIYVGEVEQHVHRFLWRNLEERTPDVYVICRVNMGDRPASAISTEAIYLTADRFKEEYPMVSTLLRHSTYVDDIVDSFDSADQAKQVACDTSHVLKQAGFTIKHWLSSGDSTPRADLSIEASPSSEDVDSVTAVLGVPWHSSSDSIVFIPKLNFSKKSKSVYTEADLTVDQVPQRLPLKLTRRSVLEQTMKIYDPLGLYSPFTLQAKKLLRETWSRKLEWDDELSQDLYSQWVKFFSDLFTLQNYRYDRCLKPENAVGLPMLVILSDASDIAFGYVAYIRWKLDDDSYWCRMIMSKSRISPLRKVATPQMELNASVLSARGRKLIEKEMRFEFDSVRQLVDSETVLCMINKVSTRFKLYEGVRVGEVQASTNGDMTCWSWVKGEENTADWLTRCKDPAQLGPESEWWRGPSFLYRPVDQWQTKSYSQCKESVCSHLSDVIISASTDTSPSVPLIAYERFSSSRNLIRVMARILNMFKVKSFSGLLLSQFDPELLQSATDIVLRDVQSHISSEISKAKSRFAKLVPVQNSRGLWCVGKRLIRANPMSRQCELQILLPNDHYFTELLIMQAHVDGGHRGRDSTLARFRNEFWITQGSKVVKKVINSCQLCRVRDAKFGSQEMGLLPEERLKVGPPFNTVMIDLFGPYSVRGEVQKRITGKAYGVLFVDLCSRAVHTEVVPGYDTASFLMALRRFTSLRGWPSVILSDRGTQLVAAEKELTSMWESMNRDQVYRVSSDNGTVWRFGSADSPWHQGAVEALVKSVKRCIKFSVNDQKLTLTELSTLLYEVSNILNERPLGVLPGDDADINILTPNMQLIGRPFARNPGGWCKDSRLSDRLDLVDEIADRFWKQWTTLYAPTLATQPKWYKRTRNLQPGDVVAVADSNSLRGRYYLARVMEVHPGRDGVVRRVTICYKSFKAGDKLHEYTGGRDVTISRSVQRLALLVPAALDSSAVE